MPNVHILMTLDDLVKSERVESRSTRTIIINGHELCALCAFNNNVFFFFLNNSIEFCSMQLVCVIYGYAGRASFAFRRVHTCFGVNKHRIEELFDRHCRLIIQNLI